MPEPPSHTPQQRLFYSLLPLFLLILCLGAINLLPRWLTASQEISTNPLTPSSISPLPPSPYPFLTPSPVTEGYMQPEVAHPFTTSTLPSNTPVPTATFPPDAIIELLGPPVGSIFQIDAPTVFYWQWPVTLAEGQQFSVYLLANGQEHHLGTVTEPNLGSSYRLQAVIGELGKTAETLQWQVRLENILSPTPLVESESRSITLMTADN